MSATPSLAHAPRLHPFFLEAGTGPGIVCLHSSASTSGQWRSLMDLLAPRYRVLAPDSYGAGRSPRWISKRPIRLRDEVALVEPVLASAGARIVLVGHSYGAAVALLAALADPARVQAMALYEPTLFAVVDADQPPPNEVDGFRAALADVSNALEHGNRDAAAERFVDYWAGDGSWKRTPESHKPHIAASVANVPDWAHALLTEATPLSAFRSFDAPVLYMTGTRSPASSRGVARVLLNALPRVEHVEFDDLGHMAPVTHADRVNEVIRGFLERAWVSK